MQLRASHCPNWRELQKEAVLGQPHSLAVGGRERCAETFGSVSVSVCIYAVSLHGSHRCFTPPGQWSLANVYSTTLQRFALHFQTSNFILIKMSPTEESPNRPNQNILCRPCLVEHKPQSSFTVVILHMEIICGENIVYKKGEETFYVSHHSPL